MKRRVNLLQRIRLFFEIHWIKIVVALVLILSTLWPIYAMATIDSYQRSYILAFASLTPLSAILSAVAFVFLYKQAFMGGGFFQFSKSAIKGRKIAVKWDDVIGMDEAKQEAWEVVGLLRDHAKITAIGGKILRGVLLIGPPGCGKTYLAKAIATEAGLPFLSISGSEFVEVFVGTGPARVRKLFKQARQLARTDGGCIIFIDELDAAGSSRTTDLGFGGQTEHNNTVNELLIQMDGLESKQFNIVVIGATNAGERSLDSALLRPGRLDRKIYVDRPGLEDREKLFKYYLSKVKAEPNIDIGRLARRAVWKSPADIENLVQESALIATRNKHDLISFKDVSEALERIDMGLKRYRKMVPEEREATAYHEAGHLITLYLLHPTDDVFKASIYMRSSTLGVVYHAPRDEFYSETREMLMADIKVSLAGYVAEKLKCRSTTSGVSADFKHAMSDAHRMVWSFGMGTNGFIGDYEVLTSSWAFRASASGDHLSDRVKEKLNEETHKILNECMRDVDALLRREDALLERFKDELLKKNELEFDEIEAIFKEYGKQRVLPAPGGTTLKPPSPAAPA
jgi:cell division protease FtsH